MKDIQRLKDISSQVRRDIIRQVHHAKSGHPGGSLGCADLLVSLYFEVMEHSSDFSMTGKGEDMFFLSNGHISPVWYSVLARAGYFPVDELATFRKIDTRLQGHPTTHEGLPGVRIASGSLGQGISVAIGAALAKRLEGDDHMVYCLTGDGELQEGQIWEAALFAPHYDLDHLVVIVDRNGQQIDGACEDVMDLGDLENKWSAFGWETHVMDGHDYIDILQTLDTCKQHRSNGKPKCIIMRTVMGQGVDYMMHTHAWHGKAPNDDQTTAALAQLEETLGDYTI